MIEKEGTTRECLFHFFNSLKKIPDNERTKTASEFVHFLGVTGDSVNDWADGRNFPIGLNLLRVRYYLERLGYRIVEIRDIPDSVRKLNELIANRIINPNEAAEKMKFPSLSELFRVLLAKRITKSKVDIIHTFVQNISLEKNLATEIHSSSVVLDPSSLDKHLKESGIFEELFKPMLIDALVALHSIERIIIPQVKDLLSADEESRILFRKGLEAGFLFNLSNKTHKLTELLNALCSEKSLESLKSNLK